MKKRLVILAAALLALCVCAVSAGAFSEAAEDSLPRVASGQMHTLVLDGTGNLYATGGDLNGQIGDGDEEDNYGFLDPEPWEPDQEAPALIMSGVTTVAAHGNYSMAVTESGDLYEWGLVWTNGGNNAENVWSPRKILSGVRAVTVGGNGIGMQSVVALMNDGTLMARGNNSSGQLGFEDTEYREAFTAVEGVSDVAAVSMGENDCMLLKTDGTVWVTGGSRSPGFKKVAGLPSCRSISAGSYAFYALTDSGRLYSWGSNFYGQLGVGETQYESNPDPLFVMEHVASVSGGHTNAFAVTTDGKLYGWGWNDCGQLALGYTRNGKALGYNTPMYITGFVDSVYCEGSTVLAVKHDGTLWGWGTNSRGVLGQRDNGSAITVPRRIRDCVLPRGSLYLPDCTAMTVWNGHKYAFFDSAMTWKEAERFCEDRDGHLVAITSLEEQEAVEELISSAAHSESWLGLAINGKRWVTGEHYEEYSNWDDGYAPQNGCALMRRTERYRWRYPVDQETCTFVCEWENTDVTVSFYLNNGTWEMAQRIVNPEGGFLTAPEEPKREGYIFSGWYPNSACYGRAWDFDRDTMTESGALYAHWRRSGFDFDRDIVSYSNNSLFFGSGHVYDYASAELFNTILYEQMKSDPSMIAFALQASASDLAYAYKMNRVYEDEMGNGLCFGSCVLMGLNYYGCIDLDSLGYACPGEIEWPKNDAKVLSLLCDLHMLQRSSRVFAKTRCTRSYALRSFRDSYIPSTEKELWEAAAESIRQGKPAIITLYYKGHFQDDYTYSRGPDHEVFAFGMDTEPDGTMIFHIADPNNLGLETLRKSNPDAFGHNPVSNETITGELYVSKDGDLLDYKEYMAADAGDPPEGVCAVITDFSPFTTYNIPCVKSWSEAVARGSASLMEDETADDETISGQAGDVLLYVSCPDFTVSDPSGEWSETVTGGALPESSQMVRGSVSENTYLYLLPRGMTGCVVTPRNVGDETVKTAVIYYRTDVQRDCFGVTASGGAQVELAVEDSVCTVRVAGAEGTSEIAAAGWNVHSVSGNFYTTALSVQASEYTARCNLTYHALTVPDGETIGPVTFRLSDLWNTNELTGDVQSNKLNITCGGKEITLQYVKPGQRAATYLKQTRTFSVSFLGVGTEGMTTLTDLSEKSIVDLPEKMPRRPGYRFDCWSSRDSARIPVPSGLTLKALRGGPYNLQDYNNALYATWIRESDKVVRFTVGDMNRTVHVTYDTDFPESAVPTAESLGLDNVTWNSEELTALLNHPVTEDVTISGSTAAKEGDAEIIFADLAVNQTAEIHVPGFANMSLVLVAAWYDEEGRMLHADRNETVINAGGSRLVSLLKPETASSVKVMLLDENAQPICESEAAFVTLAGQ